MVAIEAGWAQQIVERTMKIIPFSVNVMDGTGTIIASGNPARIGTSHPGAQWVLARNETVEIENASLSRLPGAQAGINLPLSVRGETCGVVGLTGEPDAVRHYAALVRLTAEMILEQAQLSSELQREKGYREEFAFQWVKRSGAQDASGMVAWATRLGLDLRQPRAVFVIRLADTETRPDLALLELQRIQSELSLRWPERLSAVISPCELVWLEVFEASGSQAARAAKANKSLTAIGARIDAVTSAAWCLSMGVSLPGLDGASASYEAAIKALRAGKARLPEARLFSYYELSLPVLLAGLDTGWQSEQLRQPLIRLQRERKSAVLIQTLSVWFAHGNQPGATAKALAIHRNTLDYRLLKISELTGLDLADIDDLLLLYVALQLNRADVEDDQGSSRKSATGALPKSSPRV